MICIGKTKCTSEKGLLNSYPIHEKYEVHFLNESMMCCIPCKTTPKVSLEFSFQSQTYTLNNYSEIEQNLIF